MQGRLRRRENQYICVLVTEELWWAGVNAKVTN